MNAPKFNESEKQLINNFCKDLPTAKPFGTLEAKKYVGNNQTLAFLNLLKEEQKAKKIGDAKMIREGEDFVWYLWAIDGEKYRIPEPENGIDEVLELEFKRY